MEIPFGKFQGLELSELGYDDLAYLRWMLTVPLRKHGLRREIEYRITDLEWELHVLATYYSAEADIA